MWTRDRGSPSIRNGDPADAFGLQFRVLVYYAASLTAREQSGIRLGLKTPALARD